MSAGDRCGGRWNCVLPAGHNMGKADIPENHQPPSAGDRDTLASLLAEHQPRTVWEPSNYNDPAAGHPIGVACSCGWGVEGGNSDDLHRAHLADVLLSSDWLREQRAEAWDDGLKHAQGPHEFAECEMDDELCNPYRRTTEDTDAH